MKPVAPVMPMRMRIIEEGWEPELHCGAENPVSTAGRSRPVSYTHLDVYKRQVHDTFDLGHFDAVIHLAARAGVRPSIEQPELYIDTNIKGTFHLLEAARRTGVKHFVFASSSSVYGVNKKVPFAEADPILQTISPYAMTKMAGEQMCSNYSHLYGMKTVALRFFTVYGPRQRPDLAISKFSRLIEDGKPIDKYGDRCV